MHWHWMSFCDPKRPAGQQFLGVCIIEAEDARHASIRSHMIGVNPGGEIQIRKMPDGTEPPAEFRDRLLGREEAETAMKAVDLVVFASQARGATKQ